MRGSARAAERGLARWMAPVEAVFGRLYGWRYNPIHHSGAIVVVLLVSLIVTGLYLLLFYRVGSPYESTVVLSEQAWSGRWIRSLHRFASDTAVIAILVHSLKMFAQSRSWGPRLLAWVSGVLLLAVFMLCGWTGFVLVWDVQGQVLAMEAARMLDVLPILSEPLSRTFLGERPLPSAFFFITLFLHVALPLAMGVLLWLHVARVARPKLLPPRPVSHWVIGALTLVAILWPAPLGPAADPFLLPSGAPFDIFFSFWVPVTRGLSPWMMWALATAIVTALLLVPVWTRRVGDDRPKPSVVDERLCTGCEQCAADCPFDAITMIARVDGREGLVAKVDPDLCVSCGVCAGSCAPMVVGPPGRSGRDQLARAKAFVAAREPGPADVVVIGCTSGAGGIAALARFDGADVLPVQCAGSLHTSVIEYLLRAGAGGVMVASCPETACRTREGVKWLDQRMFHEREAELQARVDRERVRHVSAGAAERSVVREALDAFRQSLAANLGLPSEPELDLIALCERASEGAEDRAAEGAAP